MREVEAAGERAGRHDALAVEQQRPGHLAEEKLERENLPNADKIADALRALAAY